MFELKALMCQNCGGTIDRATMKCEYCGTQYEKQNNGVSVNFMVERPGVHKIAGSVRIPEEDIRRGPPEIMQNFIMDKMRNSIADGLLEYLRITTSQDHCGLCRIIRGEVRVLDPSFEY
jgi:hypothetical protein